MSLKQSLGGDKGPSLPSPEIPVAGLDEERPGKQREVPRLAGPTRKEKRPRPGEESASRTRMESIVMFGE